jgi:hypothetical protein
VLGNVDRLHRTALSRLAGATAIGTSGGGTWRLGQAASSVQAPM